MVENHRGRPAVAKQVFVPRVLTPEEMKALWSTCKSEREQGLVAVVMDNGIRIRQVADLTKADIGLDHLRVQGEAGEYTVPLTYNVRDLLLSLGDEYHIWVGVKGPLTRHGIQITYRGLFRRAGITGRQLGPQTLRNTFATHYLRNGGHVLTLKEILGHKDIGSTMTYAYLAGYDAVGDHARYSPVTSLGLLS